MKKLKFILIPLLLFTQAVLFGQSGKDLVINEILVLNEDNFVDDYGQRNGWIEIFNTAYNTVDVAGMYLTNDPDNPTKYWIPKGDPRTRIAPRNYIIFYADDHPTRGIQHVNFKLEDSDWVALYDVNGRDLIDAQRYVNQKPDVSWGRLNDGSAEIGYLEKTTPGANNFTGVVVTAGERFVRYDPSGAGMAVIAMSVVFISLILLYLLFKNITPLYSFKWKDIFKPHKKLKEISETKGTSEEISGEVNAAIAMGLHMHIASLNEEEDTILTIKKVSRTYSPWSSKIYGLRQSVR